MTESRKFVTEAKLPLIDKFLSECTRQVVSKEECVNPQALYEAYVHWAQREDNPDRHLPVSQPQFGYVMRQVKGFVRGTFRYTKIYEGVGLKDSTLCAK